MTRFSLVVTTTDRPGLLLPCIRSVLAIDFDDFELLVSDNFSQKPASEILADVHDKRLRIIRTEHRLPVTDHWEFVWDHVNGEYVMYLGDDNALHPGILAVADRAIRDHDLDILSWRVCSYYHPDWDIEYGSLPDRGNIVGIDLGTTEQLYTCYPEPVLEHYCRELRLHGCYPCMLNSLFRKANADMVRRRMGRFFWPPNPDIGSSYLLLGVARRDGYAFFDGFGGIGGRSRDSNVGSLLSRGKASRRVYDYMEEFRGQDVAPRHEPKFIAMSNMLAAPISQAKALMPDYFGRYDFDRTTLARKTIDDIYVERTVPWIDDAAFLAEVDGFIGSLSPSAAAEISGYRDECLARMQQVAGAGSSEAGFIRNSDQARAALADFWRKADAESRKLASRLMRDTRRNPIGRYWTFGGTTYVDMYLYGGRDIADAARTLPGLLSHFNRHGEVFANHYRQIGILGDPLTGAPAGHRPALVAEAR